MQAWRPFHGHQARIIQLFARGGSLDRHDHGGAGPTSGPVSPTRRFGRNDNSEFPMSSTNVAGVVQGSHDQGGHDRASTPGGASAPAPRYRCSATVMACAFGEGIALLDANSNTYFSLDPVGAVVWNAMSRDGGSASGVDPSQTDPSSVALDELCDAVAAEFDVAPETCRPDIVALLGELRTHGLCEAVA